MHSANRTHGAGHTELYTHARLENPSDPNSYFQPSFCPSTGSAYIHHVRFRTGFHSRRRARGGLVRSTARTPRSLLCKSGAVLETATAATRPLSLVWCRLHRHSKQACTPACHDAYTPYHDTLTRTCGCVFPHTNRHCPLIPRPHTRGFSHTSCLFHTRPFTHARHFTHAMRAFQHAFRHTRKHTHRNNHAGDSRFHKSSRGLHTPQAPLVPVHSTRPLYLAKLDRTHLVAIRLKGAYSSPCS